MMKILYYGGQKSGKSLLAERKTIALTPHKKPFYIATYNNNYADREMQERLQTHQSQREGKFITIEEPLELNDQIEEQECYLIDCISMWILNTIEKPIEVLFEELEQMRQKNAHLVFVLNNVNEGVIPLDKESRKFVDRTGMIGQKLANLCDEVYEVTLGLERRLK